MNHTIYQGREYVVSRQRAGMVELVDIETCDLIKIDPSDLGEVTYIHRPPIPGMVPFSDRPREFLSELRKKRTIRLEKIKKARATAPKTPRPSKRVSKAATSPAMIEKIKLLPPDLREATASALGIPLEMLK